MGMEDVLNHRTDNGQTIRDNEAVIDYLTDAISDFLVKFNVQEISDKDARYVTRVYQTLTDLERLGDYAEILLKLTERSQDKNLMYSESARSEMMEIYSNALRLYDQAAEKFYGQDASLTELKRLAKIQRDIRKQTNQSQLNHMDRMRAGECSAEAGIIFGDLLNCLNRIGGHAINIAEASVEA